MQILSRFHRERGEDTTATARRALGRRLARGTTLVEVLIVVAIIALIAGGVGFFAFPQLQKARVTSTETACKTIRNAAQTWMATGNEGCPTVAQLLQDRVLDPATNTKDPWGGEFTLSCESDSSGNFDITVSSNGPDKKAGSADDIRVPKGAPAGQN